MTGRCIDAPATRRSLARRWGIVLGLAVAAGLLLAGTAWVVHEDAQARALQHEGVRADATVVSVDAQATGRGRFPNGSVLVQFSADDQEREASVYVGGAVVDYEAGQQTLVVYDAADPSRVELVGVVTSGPGVPAVPLLVGGLLLGVMAVVAGRHVERIHRVLRRERWTPLPARLEQEPMSIGFRRGSRILAVLDTSEGEVTVEPVGLSRLDPTFEPEAWVAGLGNGRIVLATPGGGHVVGVTRR